jgi:hypothetical protein
MDGDAVRGWGQMALSAEAMQAVQDYEGIDGTLFIDSASRK